MVRIVPWWRRASVEVRSTIAATAVLAILMVVASGSLLVLLRWSLIQGVDESGTERAAGIAAQIELNRDGSIKDVDGALRSVINAEAARRSWVQVLDARARVLAGSSDIQAADALVDLRPAPGEVLITDETLPFDKDPYRVVARGGSSNGHDFIVLIGQSLGPLQASIDTTFTLLAVGVPVLLVILGGATYFFARRSMRPVEAIRATVASISDQGLGERVAVPPAEDALSRLARTMNAMLGRLEAAQQVERQFIADASHELRSPIATLATTAEIHLRHPDPDGAQDFAEAVLEESRRLQDLVDDLLLLARADERGLRTGTVHDVDLDDIVDGERRRVAALTELSVEARIAPARVAGDPHQLRQVIRNLVDNAVHHARSRIEFTVRREQDQIVFEIFNDGPPIEPDDRERIFGRFVRLEESRARATGGTGLGLAIVRELVTANGGSVRVIDEPDGARFQVRLPAVTPPTTA